MNSNTLYSWLAPIYDTILSLNGYRRAVDFAIASLPFETSQAFTALDAGCGTGLYTCAILKRFPNARVIAFDLNSDMADRLKANLVSYGFETRATVFTADILGDVPIHASPFDIIVTGGVLEYVPIERAVRHIGKHLAKDGYFLNSPVRHNFLGIVIGIFAGFKPYKRHQSIEAFTGQGFELVRKIAIPLRFAPICFIKEVHLFRKL